MFDIIQYNQTSHKDKINKEFTCICACIHIDAWYVKNPQDLLVLYIFLIVLFCFETTNQKSGR
jgi:hypothetical protein